MQKVKRNAAKCAHCGTVLESTHRHDFKEHTCGDNYFAVDGGLAYVRRMFAAREDFVELSEYESH